MSIRKKNAAPSLPPRDAGSGVRAKSSLLLTPTDTDIDDRIFALATAVAQDDGRGYPPEWAAVADAAKRRGYLNEVAFKLYLTKHGEEWLAQRAGGYSGSVEAMTMTMTKITKHARLALKDMARETDVSMQDVLSHVIDTVYDNRDELTRIARKNGARYPWEAIAKLVK